MQDPRQSSRAVELLRSKRQQLRTGFDQSVCLSVLRSVRQIVEGGRSPGRFVTAWRQSALGRGVSHSVVLDWLRAPVQTVSVTADPRSSRLLGPLVGRFSQSTRRSSWRASETRLLFDNVENSVRESPLRAIGLVLGSVVVANSALLAAVGMLSNAIARLCLLAIAILLVRVGS